MSDEHNNEIYNQAGRSTMMFSSSSSSYDDAQAFDPSSYMSLTECLQIGALDFNSLATSFGLPDQQGNNNKDKGGDSPRVICNCSLDRNEFIIQILRMESHKKKSL